MIYPGCQIIFKFSNLADSSCSIFGWIISYYSISKGNSPENYEIFIKTQIVL